MWKQIKLLTGIQLKESYGFNEMRYSNDSKKKRKFVSVCFGFGLIGLMLILYISIFSLTLCSLGVAKALPGLLLLIASLTVLFFSLFKAGARLFNIHAYERSVVLPLKPTAIVLSNFLMLYISELIFSSIIVIPGLAVYAIFVNPPILFYFIFIISLFFVPMIPLTIASIFSALIVAITSKFGSKKIIGTFISIILLLIAILLPQQIMQSFDTASSTDLINMFTNIQNNICSVYFPALLFSESINNSNLLAFVGFILSSIILLSVFVFIVNKHYFSICSLLNLSPAKSNYKMQKQSQKSNLFTMFKKEFKLYISCTVYMFNTITGYLFALILSVAILIIGVDTVGNYLFSPEIIKVFLPFILAFLYALSPTTASSISIEGKNWWIYASLPITTKNVVNSKILLNLALAIPTHIICCILAFISMDVNALFAAEIIVLPLVYILFSSVIGIALNINNPIFNWTNEATVVKQSQPVLITMLFSFISIIIPVVLSFFFAQMQAVIFSAFAIILLVITVLIYNKICKIKLNQIK